MLLRTLSSLSAKPTKLVVLRIDYLWYSAAIFQNFAEYGPRPYWIGYIELSYRGIDHSLSSQMTLLSFIDLSPIDESCIFSTSLHVIKQARKFAIVTPCVTFDQPLLMKAVEIIRTEHLKIVTSLGGFLSLTSFVSSIGMVMEGFGLVKLLDSIYAPNSVLHLLSGKAIERVLEDHFLADTPLKIMLFSPIFPSCKNFKEPTVDDISENQLFFKQFTVLY